MSDFKFYALSALIVIAPQFPKGFANAWAWAFMAFAFLHSDITKAFLKGLFGK